MLAADAAAAADDNDIDDGDEHVSDLFVDVLVVVWCWNGDLM